MPESMKKNYSLTIYVAIAILLSSCASQKTNPSISKNEFSIVFMTDIHLQPELNAVEGFRKAMDTINKIQPDFVFTGGDLIMDALAQNQLRADSLYDLYNSEIKRLNSPVYNTLGNHELFGVYKESGIDTTHELYAHKMYERRIGKSFYSFNHKGWKFIVLNAVSLTPERNYTGNVSQSQIKWLREELFNTSSKMPVVLVLHIPLLTSLTQFNQGAMAANSEGLVVNNSREIIELFKGYNLKLVLQGHLHVLEDNYIKNIHFVTGGAICGKWWKGPNEGTEEGFLHLRFKGDEFTWKYVDYGWDPK